MNLELKANLHLVRITKWLTILMILIIPIQVIIFLIEPMPDTALGWLELMRDKPLLGLMHLDVLYIVNNTFLIFLYFTIYITLKKEKSSLLNIALITGVIGAVLYYTSNRSIEMLMLSDKFFASNDMLLKTSYLATAESYLDIWKGTAFNVYYVLSAVSLILFSIVMLKDSFYTKATGIIGLISGILMSVPSSVGMIGMIMALLSLIPWVMFCVLIVIRLFKLEPLS
ncbi:MAG: hypothetical protein RQ856_05505 [Candidatus Izemoplasmatales bacterium]|nr:hypothetical protein [Candidatus Izemoplasmatales bacterium]